MKTSNPGKILHEKQAEDNEERQRIIKIADNSESRELKVKLAAAYRMLALQDLDDGIAGHISMRVPGEPEYFWVNPFGFLFSEVRADNLVLVNSRGEIVDGGDMINLAGFCIHSAVHRARPDVHCIAHTHPPAGSAFSSLGILMEPLDQTSCSFYEDHGLYKEYTGIVVEQEQTNDIVSALGSTRALILANHGLLTCAATIEQALIDMIDMERTCRVNLDAMATGRTLHPVPAEAALHSRSILTQAARYPFQWKAMMRKLDQVCTDYNPW